MRKAWPPVPATTDMMFPAGNPGTLGAIDRPMARNVTYNEIPLYYYAKATRPGDTNGQEVGDVWYIVTPGMKFGDEPHEADEEAGSATPASS